MDLDSVADELYALSPSDFTATRDTQARTARRAGDRALADRIKALRRPTLAAWAANQLVRTAPDETGRFLSLGEELRHAYRELDGAQLRELARTQRRLIAALSRQARDIAAEAGHPIGDAAQREVERTLQAALSDADAAREWATGRLTKPLTPPTGFTEGSALEGAAAPSRSRPARQPTSKKSGAKSERAKRDRHEVTDLDQARERRRKQEQEADEARRAADEAVEQAHRREADRTTAADELARAKERRKEADDRLAAAREELRDAERAQQAAADAERTARDGAREASRAAREAERAARRAADKADRLGSRRPRR